MTTASRACAGSRGWAWGGAPPRRERAGTSGRVRAGLRLPLAPAGRGGGVLRPALPPLRLPRRARGAGCRNGSWSLRGRRNPNRCWGSESRQWPGLRRLALRPCEVRARRRRALAPAATRLRGALPGLAGEPSFHRAGGRHGLVLPPALTCSWLRTPLTSTPLVCAPVPPAPLLTFTDQPGTLPFLSESFPSHPIPGPPVTALFPSLCRWTGWKTVRGSLAPLSGPIEAVCPPWEPEVGPCLHLPTIPSGAPAPGMWPWLLISSIKETLRCSRTNKTC